MRHPTDEPLSLSALLFLIADFCRDVYPDWTRAALLVYHGPECPPTAIQIFPSPAWPGESHPCATGPALPPAPAA